MLTVALVVRQCPRDVIQSGPGCGRPFDSGHRRRCKTFVRGVCRGQSPPPSFNDSRGLKLRAAVVFSRNIGRLSISEAMVGDPFIGPRCV